MSSGLVDLTVYELSAAATGNSSNSSNSSKDKKVLFLIRQSSCQMDKKDNSEERQG